MARRVPIWTWDRGRRLVDMDGPANHLTPILQTVLDGGLWTEFRKFPPDTLARLLPSLQLAPQTRRLVELWIEEHGRSAA